jgi:hypothetical protein
MQGAGPTVTLRAPRSEIQRACAACEQDDERIDRQADPGATTPQVDSDVAKQIHGLRGAGTTVPGPLRGDMEARFGRSFAAVRVHTDDTSAKLTRRLHARAFTVGNDIFFRPGELSPTRRGRTLLAHELTHVLQQNDPGVIHRKAEPGTTANFKPSCQASGFVQAEVEAALAAARLNARVGLGMLEALAEHGNDVREQKWNNGAFRCWFGDYKRSRYRRITGNMRRLVRALERNSLKIDCDSNMSLWGEAFPAISKITLGASWLNASPSDPERIQTIIHEASHIAGVSVLNEGRFKSKQWTFEAASGRPDVAVHISESYGWFAMAPHEAYSTCSTVGTVKTAEQLKAEWKTR